MNTILPLPDRRDEAPFREEPNKGELADALDDLVSDDMHEGDFLCAIDQEATSEKLSMLIKGLLDAGDTEAIFSARLDIRDYMSDILTAYYKKREELVAERAYEIMDEETA